MGSKVALVTGGGRRIGAAIVKHLHRAGFRLLIHCHNSLQEAQALATLLNGERPNSATVLQRDLSAANAAKQLLASAETHMGRLDLLVNNAALFKSSPPHHFCETDWQSLFALNVKAPYQLSLAAFPYLSPRQGAIINITDIHAAKPLRDYGVYCQTKAALNLQTKALAKEFAPTVRVNAIAPGAILWPEKQNHLSDELKAKIIAKTPLRCHGEPEFIAQAVLALAENSFITGQVLPVDGGRSID